MTHESSRVVANGWVDSVAARLLPQVLMEFGAVQLMVCTPVFGAVAAVPMCEYT